MGDCHLGGWRQPELRQLNMESFRFAINSIIKERLDFVLVAGDLFDSPYPPIEIIKDTFDEFRKLKEENIPVFIIAGSHDFSAAGKSFLDVLEKAGFARNVFNGYEKQGKIILEPVIYKNVAIYGYPGKKSGLEVPDIERIKINDSPGLFRILMLHTSIRDALRDLPIPAVDQDKLPKVDYLALAHLHIKYNKNAMVYCGPTFPNNSEELEELKGGSFYIVDTHGKIERREIKLKDILILKFSVTNAISANDEIKDELKKHDVRDKVVILKISGTIESGKASDIKFNDIEEYLKRQGAFALLRSTSKLYTHESEISIEYHDDNLEEEIIKRFKERNPHPYNELSSVLFNILQSEKKEEEKSTVFEERLFSEVQKYIEL